MIKVSKNIRFKHFIKSRSNALNKFDTNIAHHTAKHFIIKQSKISMNKISLWKKGKIWL